MNIQGFNLVSLLAGTENAAGLNGLNGLNGLFSGEGGAAGFSDTLMRQLTALQQAMASGGASTAGDLSLPSQVSGSEGQVIDGQTLQNFAALFGKRLPATTVGQAGGADSAKSEIDLDDTLQALAEVLQSLQSLEAAAPEAAQATPVAEIDTSTEQSHDSEIRNLTEQLQAALDAAGVTKVPASKMAELGSQTSAEVSTQTAATVSAQTDEQVANALQTASAIGQERQPAKLQTAAGRDALLATLTGDDAKNLTASAATSIGSTAGSEAATGNAGGQTGNNEQAPQQPSSDSGLSAVKVSAESGDSADSRWSRVAADVGQLNRVAANAGPQPEATVIGRPVNHPEWNAELGQKLLWMHNQAVPSAEIRLNPEHLGPISIKIDVNQDQANVTFTTQHAVVKEAIEAAIPKLREMLGGQNLNLADVNVSQQQSEQRSGREGFQMAGDQQRGRQGQASGQEVSVADPIIDEIETGRAIASNGLLSLFA
ncbi:flagellar hook-length control protein FliK [Methylomonas sp. MED-D]|uniref:flagellar hook-length control protein FliK n=1 Tax=unclassified Methylomonas TaxID=2608980 RepID=UPI0028A50C51|nr:flagellar hook-length control protein FliK [Methylomonas sp. MV1]MDT4329228.1 flagellar hook-length control protein FliK [Methylomonas sp. MV1]